MDLVLDLGKSQHICVMVPDRYAFLQQALNFPCFEFDVQQRDGKLVIFDALRKKFLILTPEEWVRQHLIRYLVEYREYPKSLFALEKGIQYNSLQKRFDILVLDKLGEPFLLIECKAPEVKLSMKTVEQVTLYNKVVKARHIGISNGKNHLFLAWDQEMHKYQQIANIPDFL